jgi:ribulose-5-phosphate 4-epimerase/fuculose-1-phosphate aldolase
MYVEEDCIMTISKLANTPKTLRDRVSADEWKVRVDLAACYRLAAYFRLTDLIYTHISARVPGAQELFLINAYGQLFEEITASSLVKVTLDGDIVDDETGLGLNPAGYVIHSAIHGARHDVGCVMHTHSGAGLAVAAQRQGLLPLTQHAMRFSDCLSYHDYEGIALDTDERQRLIHDLGANNAMILRNHGLLTCGVNVAQAFDVMYYLERACQAQIGAMAGGAELNIPAPCVAAKVARQFKRPARTAPDNAWAALLRMLDRADPSFRS